MDNELIVVKQLPVIEEQCRSIRPAVEARLAEALDLPCTEETVKEVKKARAELNALFKELESKRKEVKTAIELPYKEFEAVYKECIGNLFAEADKELARKISSVESGLKDQKRGAVENYFNEYRDSLGIASDLATFEKSGLNITLSASEKSLKTACKGFIDKISDELKLISTQEFSDEILIEYRKTLNVYQSIQIVTARHEEMRKMQEFRERAEQLRAERQQHTEEIKKVAEEVAPVVVEEPVHIPVVIPPAAEETVYEVNFTVRGTLDMLKALKVFLNDGGYEYEQHKRNDASAA